ncbi:MAG: radical SAM protein, partial [Minisyncoccia bacterium]
MDYKQLKTFLSQANENKSIPLFGVIEPTYRCNLRCVHCYIPKNKKYTNSQKELSLLEIKAFLQTVAKEGCLEIVFTGGEPFIRKDFLDIYTFTKKLGIIPSIYTNGTLITRQIADYLQRWRPLFIEITLYGATAKTYEKITGISGSFKKCLNGIKLLKERRVPLGLKVVVMKENLHEFYAIKKISKKFKTPFRFSTVIDAKLDGAKDPFKHRISISKGVEIEMATKEYRKKWKKSSKERKKEMEKRKKYL